LRSEFETSTKQITDLKVIRGKLYILVLSKDGDSPIGGEFIIADARTGTILGQINGLVDSSTPVDTDSPVEPFYNPGFFAGWSGDKLYVYDFASDITRDKATDKNWSGRIVEIDISDPSSPEMTRNKVFTF
jgi:hypothetical protein